MIKRLVISKQTGKLEGRPDVQPDTVIFYMIRREHIGNFRHNDLTEGESFGIKNTGKKDIKGREIHCAWYRPVRLIEDRKPGEGGAHGG